MSIEKRFIVTILAGGEGKRMNTDPSVQKPKVLYPFLGEPMIVHILRVVLHLQPDKIYIVVGKHKEPICSVINKYINDTSIEVQCANYEICKTWFKIKDLRVQTWNVCENCDIKYNTKLCFVNNKICTTCFGIKRCVSIPKCANYVCIKDFKPI